LINFYKDPWITGGLLLMGDGLNGNYACVEEKRVQQFMNRVVGTRQS